MRLHVLWVSLIVLGSSAGAYGQTPPSSAYVYADQQSGGDACAKIANAEAALPTGGGIVDARLFQGTLTACSAGLNVGTTTKPVTLLLGPSQLFVNGVVTVFPGSAVNGVGSNGQVFPSRIVAAGGFPANSPIIQFYNVAAADDMRLTNIAIDCAGITGCTGVDMGLAQEGSRLQDVLINGYRTTCVNGPSGVGENWVVDQVVCLPSASATNSNGLSLTSQADHYTIRDFSVGSGPATPQNAGVLCNGCQLLLQGAHIEDVVDAVQFTGANAGGTVVGLDGLNNVTNLVHITSSATGSITLLGLRKNSATAAVKNDIAQFGHSCLDESLSAYILSAPLSGYQQLSTTCNSLPNFYQNNGFIFPIGQGLRLVDLTPSHARVLQFGPNVCGNDAWCVRDLTGSNSLLQCSWLTPFNCTFPGGISVGSGGSGINTILSGSASLTYTAISPQTCQEKTLTVTGATSGSAAFFSPSTDLGNGNLSWSSRVSATNTVSVRVCNPSSGSITPNSVTWKGWVQQ